MNKKLTFKDLLIYDNYISNVDEILNLLKLKYDNYFLPRSIKESFTSKNDNPNGGDILDVINIYQDLYNAIFKTISKELVPNFPDEITIYRYKYGHFLKKHSDELLSESMVSDLTFLKSSKNHFKIYTTQYPNGYLIDEIPGRRIIIPGDLEHEITPIEEGEDTRYTLAMTWYNRHNGLDWWSKR